MTTAIILILVYIFGYSLSYLMLLTELKSEGDEMTIGDRALMIFLSLLSWLMIVYILLRAWVKQINKTGYWLKPLRQTDKEETAK